MLGLANFYYYTALPRAWLYNESMMLEGVFAALPTPFYPDERLYAHKLEANVVRSSRSLIAGFVVMGTTGEAAMLDDAESREVLRVAAEAAAPHKILLAGVSRESVRATLDLAEVAAHYGYDALLLHAPVYFSRNDRYVLQYFRAVADRSPLPIVLYHIPQCVPYSMPISIVAELAQHPNIIGIKDSSGDINRITQLVEATSNAPRRTATVTSVFEAVPRRQLAAQTQAQLVQFGESAPAQTPLKTRTKEVGFQVLTGSPTILLASLQAGATGAVLGFASCAPGACQEVYLAFKDRDIALAESKQQRILAPSQRITSQLGIAGAKYACDFNGYYGGKPRQPLLPLTAAEKSEVESLLANIRN